MFPQNYHNFLFNFRICAHNIRIMVIFESVAGRRALNIIYIAYNINSTMLLRLRHIGKTISKCLQSLSVAISNDKYDVPSAVFFFAFDSVRIGNRRRKTSTN